MSIKIVVSLAGSNDPMSEHSFDKGTVTIGRTLGNEVVLPDVEKKVSSKHAQIENKNGAYHLSDLGSTNGTILNGKKIEAKREVPLKSGDRIQIGSFQLLFSLTSEKLESSTTRHIDPAKAAEKLAETLALEYARHVGSPPEDRRAALRGAIKDGLKFVGPENGRTVLSLIRTRFQAAGPAAEAGPSESVAQQEELYRSGYQAVSNLSMHFLGDAKFQTAEQVERFARKIEQALDTTMEWVANCLKGRKEFENQFSADLTMVFSKEGNPLKSASGTQDMARYILDWHRERDQEDSKKPLESAFKDLTMHQLGLLAGVQDCLKALLTRLDPKALEQQAETQSGGIFKNVHKKAWEMYTKIHKEMFEENSKLFNELIYPNIRKGYLASHAGSEGVPPPAAAGGAGPSPKGESK
jgi:type VI secretion system protein ImpI/type VI secretion system protein